MSIATYRARSMAIPVTYLFVPANRTERLGKALEAGADAVILDLEDAISPDDKDAARGRVLEALASRPDALARVVIRINDESTPWFEADLELLRRSSVPVAMLPKAESAGQVNRVRNAMIRDGVVVPLIETARGVDDVGRIAAAAGVHRLAFGTLDYAVDVGMHGDERGLIYPGSRIVIASRCAGILAPIAGVTTALDDEDRLRADVAFARSLGFNAKLCIHPRQVGVVRDAMLPTVAEIDWARRVLAAAEAARGGVVQVDGKMVDRPVLRAAKWILDRSSRST